MREVGTFEAKTHLSALLESVAAGETIMITKRGRPMARLVPPKTSDLQTVDAAVARLKNLREQFGTLSVDEILAYRDEGRR
ncbi:MAG: type II toxin-antitoxin system prevent-host-death family antitoxin [Gemmatimonadota bacterium]|uniref:type II toxin-antitoxin system Phd/YefM family antitoxin n=1 Tax=Candidatus Palauibacter scopulicola TaxID=3056741 RepID=UPI0023902989|nr:type II toxin-antitoxin system prevent-host-death family antitoxin [Candidatus Palauibacter scopulicola]MDE2661503.1 type II toxin-antitoxin system prevent-host-death family antitoxin [Candidatus Palauibacter scopulicola]